MSAHTQGDGQPTQAANNWGPLFYVAMSGHFLFERILLCPCNSRPSGIGPVLLEKPGKFRSIFCGQFDLPAAIE
jgi:hypothetical protein